MKIKLSIILYPNLPKRNKPLNSHFWALWESSKNSKKCVLPSFWSSPFSPTMRNLCTSLKGVQPWFTVAKITQDLISTLHPKSSKNFLAQIFSRKIEAKTTAGSTGPCFTHLVIIFYRAPVISRKKLATVLCCLKKVAYKKVTANSLLQWSF